MPSLCCSAPLDNSPPPRLPGGAFLASDTELSLRPPQRLQLVKSLMAQSSPLFLRHAPREAVSSVLTASRPSCPQAAPERHGRLHGAVESDRVQIPVSSVSEAPTIHREDATPVSLSSLIYPPPTS